MDDESTGTEEYKDARVEFRVDWSTKAEMEREADRLGTTVSKLLRALFEDHVSRRNREVRRYR